MSHPLLRLAPHFRGAAGLVALGCTGLLLGTLLNLVGPWLVATAIDGEFARGDRAGLVRKGLLYLGLLVATTGIVYASRVVIELAAQRAMLALKERLFDHLVDHDPAFHDRQTSGRLLTRVQGDTEALRVLFTEVILPLPADLMLFVGMFAVVSRVTPELVPIVFGVLPPYVLLFVLFRKVAPQRFLAVRTVRAGLTGFLTEHLRAMPLIQGMDRGDWVRARAEAINEDVFRKDAIASLQPVWYFNTVFLVRNLGVVALLWLGAGMVGEGVLTVGALVMALAYLRQMFHPLMRMSHQLATLERARAAAVRVAGILDSPRTLNPPPDPVPWPGLRDAVRLEAVDFHYTPEAPVLSGVDLTIPAGSTVGIVGATGSGKSTLLNLLLRFRDPIAGRVTVDGVDLRAMAPDVLRARIGLVLQDVHLFAGTVLENLGGDAAAAAKALAAIGLDLPLDTLLRDGASNLSRGQRQLLTFARALVGDPDLLVLDEATSAVDPATEVRVQAALDRLREGRTMVVVAHRLVTVQACDAIHVVSDGRIVESGTHAELLALGGIYASLQRLQSGAAA